MKTIYLAGGCFWGVEAYFKLFDGIINTTVGYANGTSSNPHYEDLKMGLADHAETVKIEYDENQISLNKILKLYFDIIDPFSLNKQAHDEGLQYRTGIFYIDDKDLETILNYVNSLNRHEEFKVLIERLNNFYDAEDYHQDYLDKNPQGYCHIDINKIRSTLNK